jgi:hypothetical protein
MAGVLLQVRYRDRKHAPLDFWAYLKALDWRIQFTNGCKIYSLDRELFFEKVSFQSNGWR